MCAPCVGIDMPAIMKSTKRKHQEVSENVEISENAEETVVKEKYASSSYWDNRYANNEFHEWYYSYDDLKPILHEVMARTQNENAKVLEIGCGDAPLLTSLQAEKHKGELHCIDFSKTIIDSLIRDHASAREATKKSKHSSHENENYNGVTFTEMDARKMSYASNTFDIVIDKGTCDAMFCDKKKGKQQVKQIIQEAVRVLKKHDYSVIKGSNGKIPSSCFILISHIEVESMEFESAFSEVIIPVLQDTNTNSSSNKSVAGSVPKSATTSRQQQEFQRQQHQQQRWNWHITAHTHSNSATVYVISCTPRPFTRSCAGDNCSYPVQMKILNYADDDDDDEEDEDEEE